MFKMSILILFVGFIFVNSAHASNLVLPEHSDYAANTVKLTKADQRWLAKKGVLTVGLYGPLHPPLAFADNANILRGINAEYLSLLEQNLKIEVTIKVFDSLEMATAAIHRGEVDLVLSSLSGKPVKDSSLVKSKPLLYSYPALVSTKSDSMRPLYTDDDVMLAVTGNYPDRGFIRTLFKKATIQEFDNVFQALSSVDNGNSDFYLGDNLEAGYVLFLNFENSLNMIKAWNHDNLTVSFIMSRPPPELLRIINSFTDSITPQIQKKIVESWMGVGNTSFYGGPALLTTQEKKWIQENKKVRVIINPYHFPFTMIDTNQDIRGVIGEILDLAHIKTGLEFEPIITNSNKDIAATINKGDWDLHPAAIYSDERNKTAIFTHSFLSTPFVLVVKENDNKSPDFTPGMTIAIPDYHILKPTIEKKYPKVKLIDVENSSMAINMLTRGDVDAVISTKLSAKYYIEHYNPGELHFYTLSDFPDAQVAFAVPKHAYELRNILNKVLDDIPKEQISRLSNKWLNMPNVHVDTWNLYKTEFYLLILFSTLLIGSSFLWGMYLLQQTRMRKASERHLKEQLNFSSTLSTSIPLPLYVMTLEGEITRFNPAFSSFFVAKTQPEPGLSVAENGHPLFSIFNTMRRDLESGLFTENIVSYNIQINNGSEVREVIHWFTLFDTSESTPPLLICGWKDITESKRLTDALIIESAKANEAKQAKGAFLARMSHELRTPVSAIIGFLELIRLENKHPNAKDNNVDLAYSTGQSLLNLIGDILDIEKIDSGNFDIHPEWVDFGSLLTSTVNMFDALAMKKGLALVQQNDIRDQYPLWLDPQAIRQVLANLIGNAIKFTEQGGVTISTRLTSHDHDAYLLVINITDSGPGIPANEQEKLFQPFSQTASGKLKVGSGLGLSISHEIIGLMDGRIFISTSTSQGTTFTIEIPTQRSTMASSNTVHAFEHSATTIDGSQLNVLIVDDNSTNLLLLRRQLVNLGCRVDEATDGRQALEAIHRKSYDLLITDINMPHLDGAELAQQIRTFDTSMVIWGLTANASQQERERCLAAGQDLLLFKPINLQKLAMLLQTVTPQVNDNALENIIDMEALYSLTMGDPALISQILSNARQESEHDLLGIQHAVTSHDPIAANRLLHRLAGTVQILGAAAIVQRCETFKHHLQADITSASVTSEMDEFTVELTALFSAIDRFIG
ncbi:transporter substrate-binding domain-containing protein [Serratia fonticola]|uniref:response regulator n=1 Tax=Serratia fonticola TaxID=47917 RepID=UPI0016469B54|nr:transporter substrate-binding domain-containing protein [Serratia fonticola]MBC3252451.1 transporter substrate-binding domain-containing protein [Serratia fonticola]